MIKSHRNVPAFTNVHKIILLLLRYVVPLAALAYLVWSISRMPRDILSLWLSSLAFRGPVLWAVAFLLILATGSWMLESIKWKLLAGKIEPISLGKAFRGILFGVSMGMATPKRAGEIAGRALVLLPENQVKGMVINTAGSLSQLAVTLVFGLASLAVLLLLPASASPPGWPVLVFPPLALAVLILLLFNAHRLVRWILAKPGAPRWSHVASVFLQVGRGELLGLLGLSMFRYLVFMLQFFLLLRVFHAPLPFAASFLLLSMIYLVLAAVPLSALGEAGVRGSVALLVSGWIYGGGTPPFIEAGLVAAILGLWLVNLVIPAMVGALLALGGGVSLNVGRAWS